VAPGFAVEPRALDAGLEQLLALGYRPVEGRHLRAQRGYLAGTDDQRADDLNRMLLDPEIDAVWFARGGYGTARLLDRIPWRRLRRHPKLLIGYSDLTALFAPVIQKVGQICLYGPGVCELGDPTAYHGPSLRALLSGRGLELDVPARNVVAHGRCRGRLVGGNLSVFTHLCGTRYFPDLEGAVLFLEDTGEQVYRIDRMLTQLRGSAGLERLRGVLLGSFGAPPRRRFPPDRRLIDVLRETFDPLGIPVVRGVPCGHMRRSRTLPLGAQVRIDTDAGKIEFL
jgi:muramoyltetrapeptide carboxypeptidase